MLNYVLIALGLLVAVGTPYWGVPAVDRHIATVANAAVGSTASTVATSATSTALAAAGITTGTSVPAMISFAVARSAGRLNRRVSELSDRLDELEARSDPAAVLATEAKKYFGKPAGPGHAAVLLSLEGRELGSYLSSLGAKLEACAQNPAASYEELRQEYLADVESAGYDNDDSMHKAALAELKRLDEVHQKVHAAFAPTEALAHKAGARATLARLDLEAVQVAGLKAAVEFERYRRSIDEVVVGP